ncbi:hypothetical protein [Flavipsychrobacter stenotrophus]|uniref:hypothetical protein n=1 Tax=Flavipsychrobacter stenotrophus TaxID=2077091 RepID=UPI0010573D60|nr:hypothetical protein [Flavipsychrobacter stenotrophus]
MVRTLCLFIVCFALSFNSALSREHRYLKDTSTATLMKALYNHTIGKGDSTAGIMYRADVDEEHWMGPEDSAAMRILNKITYKRQGIINCVLVLAGQSGSMWDHYYSMYNYVFLRLTPKGWLVTHRQLDQNQDLDTDEFFFLKDSSLIYRQTTNYVIEGILTINTGYALIGRDTLTPICVEETVSSNTASGCKDKKQGCDCYDREMDIIIDHQKGCPWFTITENMEKWVFSKKTCEEIGTIKTIDTKACMNNNCVLLRTENCRTHKVKVLLQNNPKIILAALKKAGKSQK